MSETDIESQPIWLLVNGQVVERRVEPRLLLSDFLRESLGLTGTHVGCEHGVCGACTVMIDGDSMRSCLMLAVQANGSAITTVEGLGRIDQLSPLQQAFKTHHGLQCGFCTPGMLIACLDALQKFPLHNDEEIRDALSGNLCRCTGYQGIVAAVGECVAQRDAQRAVAPDGQTGERKAEPSGLPR